MGRVPKIHRESRFFRVSPDRENQIFLTYRGETINKRIDAYYYQPKFKTTDKALKNAQFDVVNLGVLISEISSGATPKVEENYYTDSSGIPFLRVQNITDDGIDLSDVKFITKKVHNGMLKRSQLKKDDLIFTITGRIGSVAVVPDNFESNINQHSARFQLKTQIGNIAINPRYVANFFNLALGQSLSLREVTGGTRPALDYKALYSLSIILPPANIQNHIVSVIRSAYTQKKQKEQEADTLLDSIDDYMLMELGIEMPTVKEKKCFVVYLGETTGRRIDPRFHQFKHREVIRVLAAGKYPIVPLSNLITDLKNGVEIRTYSDHGYRYLRVSDLGKNGIENHDPRYVDVKEIPDRIRLTNDSFLISRSGSLGLVSVIEDEIRNVVLGSDIFKVELDTESIHPRYLEAFFRSQIGQTLIFQLNSGSIIPRLDQPAVKLLRVIVPPFDVQKRIADEAIRRRFEAAKLRQEADAVVEQAKERVGRILLQ